MQVYFSLSYRDVPINTYFSELFDVAGISLQADQKTDIWCMAKLERYMFEMGGFVSIIPRRVTADGLLTYSPYIARELMLARRARTPQILFVDDQLLTQYRLEFPTSAIPFFLHAPETELTRHVEEISQFRRKLASGAARPARQYVPREATIIVGAGSMLRDAASYLAAILRREDYKPTIVPGSTGLEQAFDDINLFELVLRSELCVFVLDNDLSCPDLLLAMAHAHCVPSMRFRYDPAATSREPELSGAVKWRSSEDLGSSFSELLQNYQSAFVRASGRDIIEQLATPEQVSDTLNTWDPADGPALVLHVVPDDSYVKDRVDGVIRTLECTDTGRVKNDAVCRGLYDRIKKDHFYYTFEPVITQTHVQRIRKPREMDSLNCGTCIDFACLFASMLEGAHERPVVIVVGTPRGSHALAGYITEDAVLSESEFTLGDLRGAVNRGEVVPFETTGAVEVRGDRTVAAETETERKEGGNLLDYRTAKSAARRLLFQRDVNLEYCIDVVRARRSLHEK